MISFLNSKNNLAHFLQNKDPQLNFIILFNKLNHHHSNYHQNNKLRNRNQINFIKFINVMHQKSEILKDNL